MSNDEPRPNHPKENHPKDPRRDAVRALRVGAVLLVAGVVAVLSPLVWGRSFSWNKYFVAFGLALAFVGAGMILNGGLDWLRSNR